MYLKSITEKILFEGRFHTVRGAVEAAVKEKICLDFINLRHANLKGAALDDAQMNNACLWGASLESADLASVQLQGSDCRNVNFKDCCLAESNCYQVDFRGSYFSRTILVRADLSNTKFSCPSFFDLHLSDAVSLENVVYSHKGEIDCELSLPPIVIQGLSKNIVLMPQNILIGDSLYKTDLYEKIFLNFQDVISCEKSLEVKALI